MTALVALCAAATVVLVAGALRSGGRRGAETSPVEGPRSRAFARVVVAVVAIATAAALGPAAGALAIVVAGIGGRHRRTVVRRRSAARVAAAVPELVDLFRLAAAAGLPVATALGVVAPRAPPVLRAGLIDADRRRRRGLPLQVALERLAEVVGPSGAELVAVLDRSAHTGVAPGPQLAEVARRDRAERHARARAASGRLSVAMLFPLVLCILPAAIALAVVPVLVVSLAELAP